MFRQSLSVLACLLLASPGITKELLVRTPRGVALVASHGEVNSKVASGRHVIRFDEADSSIESVELVLKGPYGGYVRKVVPLKKEKNYFTMRTGVPIIRASNPQYIQVLPALCPRIKEKDDALLYMTDQDLLNYTPTLHLLDPDAAQFSETQETIRQFDCRNVLLVDKVGIAFDYEDPSLVKASPPGLAPLHEEQSGFYANFNIAVMPYEDAVAKRSPRDILRFAEGRASELDWLIPPRLAWRTRSFLPGPFLSHDDLLYSMCEWGDTAYQAPRQELNYRDFAVWDWDYPVGQTLLLVIWEGDEEEGLMSRGLLPKYAIMDDLVAVFTVTREEAAGGKLFVNPRGDFWIRFKEGELKKCR